MTNFEEILNLSLLIFISFSWHLKFKNKHIYLKCEQIRVSFHWFLFFSRFSLFSSLGLWRIDEIDKCAKIKMIFILHHLFHKIFNFIFSTFFSNFLFILFLFNNYFYKFYIFQIIYQNFSFTECWFWDPFFLE